MHIFCVFVRFWARFAPCGACLRLFGRAVLCEWSLTARGFEVMAVLFCACLLFHSQVSRGKSVDGLRKSVDGFAKNLSAGNKSVDRSKICRLICNVLAGNLFAVMRISLKSVGRPQKYVGAEKRGVSKPLFLDMMSIVFNRAHLRFNSLFCKVDKF